MAAFSICNYMYPSFFNGDKGTRANTLKTNQRSSCVSNMKQALHAALKKQRKFNVIDSFNVASNYSILVIGSKVHQPFAPTTPPLGFSVRTLFQTHFAQKALVAATHSSIRLGWTREPMGINTHDCYTFHRHLFHQHTTHNLNPIFTFLAFIVHHL